MNPNPETPLEEEIKVATIKKKAASKKAKKSAAKKVAVRARKATVAKKVVEPPKREAIAVAGLSLYCFICNKSQPAKDGTWLHGELWVPTMEIGEVVVGDYSRDLDVWVCKLHAVDLARDTVRGMSIAVSGESNPSLSEFPLPS
jgi:hypothetical protein